MMDKDFLLLLRAGLTGNVEDDLSGNVDWEAIGALGVSQNVLPLLYDGYLQYAEKKHVNAPVKIKVQWYTAVQQAEKVYYKHLTAIKKLSGYFAKHNIRTMVLKGFSLSLNYPKPEHRLCSDIDIYQFGDLQKADNLLQKEKGLQIDQAHHKHTVYTIKGITVENHYSFLNCHSHVHNRRMNAIMVRLADSEEPLSVDGVLLPSPNMAALYTFVHTASHFASESVALQRVCDWWLLRMKLGDRVDWAMVEGAIEDCGFMPFYRVFDEITSWLFDSCQKALSVQAEKVLNEILHPEFGRILPTSLLPCLCFRLRRWWGSRWKMDMVYSKESLLWQFLIHTRSNMMKS